MIGFEPPSVADRDAIAWSTEKPRRFPRLVNLWWIVNTFQGGDFAFLFNRIAARECACLMARWSASGAVQLVREQESAITLDLDLCEGFFRNCGLLDCADFTSQTKAQFKDRLIDHSGAAACLNTWKGFIANALKKRPLILVDEQLSGFIDSERLFGNEVGQSYPSASTDIREAGKCIAVGCCTAAVFHLMRAAEFGLRALAKDRAVSFSDRPLDEKEWGQILTNLESKVSDMRTASRSNWKDGAIRDKQIRSYAETVQELRGFNDAWRRHVSHADARAFYDPNTALGVLGHVRALMQRLAAMGISEHSCTAQYWDNEVG